MTRAARPAEVDIGDNEPRGRGNVIYCDLSRGEIAQLALRMRLEARRPAPRAVAVNPVPAWLTELARQTKKNVRARGIEYDLTEADLLYLSRRSANRCEVSGIDFVFPLLGRGKRNPFRPSIDRIDSARPYSRRNVRLVCVLANMAMNEWGEGPLRLFVERMAEKMKGNTP